MADSPSNRLRTQYSKKTYLKRNLSNDHNLKKRLPKRQGHHENAVYVTTKTNVKTLITKCEQYFDKDANEIMIYCMGAAIQRGINLALQLCEKYTSFQLSVNTSTITLTDDLEPTTEDADYEVQNRQNSVVHILVQRRKPVEDTEN